MILFKTFARLAFICTALILCCAPYVQADPVTVIDAAKRTVTLPERIDKILITCYGGVTNQIVVLGGEDKIVGQPCMDRFPQLLKMRPELGDIPSAGQFDNINIEEIIALNPDMVFAGIISKKGNRKIEEVGLPLVTMYIGKARIGLMKDEFLHTGLILGKEEKARALVDYWEEKIALIGQRVKTIPQEKRLKVYYSSHDILRTEGDAWWTQDLLELAGAVNVAADIGQGQETTLENLIRWNPDVIVAQRLKGKDRVKDILSDPQVQDIKAVKDKRVYEFPIGAFWWNRPSPEAPLGFLWLAKKLYPELMADIDMKQETKYFFKTFFGYELSDAEYEAFIRGYRAS